jgi:putative oxidoreductase
MRKLLSISYSQGAFNFGMLLARLLSGILMMNHGYDKLVRFAELKDRFTDILGLGSSFSLAMTIFAEFFCALFVIIGLFTRISVIPLIIVMAVALFKVHHADILGEGETAALFLGYYLILLIVGPGKISVDGVSGK